MTNKIYKYFSHETMEKVFARKDMCGVKCSLPKDYNDPFELFLSVDLSSSPEELATYRDIIQEIEQHPTTCFSKSPVVAPMWAHYGSNHTGFVLEFDLPEIQASNKELLVHDVDYRDQPNERISHFLAMATHRKKPRDAYFLQNATFFAAYFSKHTAWSYEKECRVVVQKEQVEDIAGNSILFLPRDCITSIIVGAKIPSERSEDSKKIADEYGLNWFSAVIGKSTLNPFMIDDKDNRFVFDGSEIQPADNQCMKCSEPIREDHEMCCWCNITEDHEREAALNNPLRLLNHLNLLDGYYESMDSVRKPR